MAEYIEKEKIVKVLRDACIQSRGFYSVIIWAVAKVIEKIPAADVRPVVRGKWELHRENQNGDNWDRWICSKCGYVAAKGWEHTRYGAKPQYNFCPNCGATMEES